MTIENMRLFAEVVKHGSYTKTAESLDVSKSYLSQKIKHLEQMLGKQLLVRNTRTMRLTSAGDILYKEAVKLTDFWSQTKALLEQTDEELAGTVKCTAPIGVARYLLYPLFDDILAKYPDISLLMDAGNNTHNLISDDFDFAIRITNTPPEDMIAKKLLTINYLCCASPDFIIKHGRPNQPQDLLQLDCLALVHWREWTFTQGDQVEKIMPNGKFLCSDNDMLKEACLAGRGIARLPQYLIEEELKRGELCLVLPTIQCDTRNLYLIYPQLSTRPKRVSLYLKVMIDKFCTS